MKPTKAQRKQFYRSALKASQGSYEKQMAILRKYPEELACAVELAKF